MFWKREEKLENPPPLQKSDHARLLTNEKNVFGASEPIEKGHFIRELEREKSDGKVLFFVRWSSFT